jgi:hypothetical protein
VLRLREKAGAGHPARSTRNSVTREVHWGAGHTRVDRTPCRTRARRVRIGAHAAMADFRCTNRLTPCGL